MTARVLRLYSGDKEAPPYPKCSLWLRVGARGFDIGVALLLAAGVRGAGMVLALLYLLVADGLSAGQSPGKRIFGVKVLHLPSHSAGRYRESVLRNAPFGLVVLFALMPRPLGPGAFVVG